MKRFAALIFAAALLLAPHVSAQTPVGGVGPSQPIYTPPASGGGSLPDGSADGQILTWDFASGASEWSSAIDPDMIAGDTADDDAIDTAVLSADAQASLGLADSAVQSGDTVSFGGVTDTSTGASNIAVGTTGSRPAGTAGDIRLNSTLGALEAYDGAAWDSLVWSGDLATIATTGDYSDLTGAPSVAPSTADGQLLVGAADGSWDVAAGLEWLNNTLSLGNYGTLLETGTTLKLQNSAGSNPTIYIETSDLSERVLIRGNINRVDLIAGGNSGIELDGSGTYPETTVYGGATSGAVGTALTLDNPETGADGGGVGIDFVHGDALDSPTTLAQIQASWLDESAGTTEVNFLGADQYVFGNATVSPTAGPAEISESRIGGAYPEFLWAWAAEEKGSVWTDLGQQASETYIYSLAYVGDGVVLAGSYPNGKIFRSTDSGSTWSDLGQQASEIHILSLAYVGDGVVLAGSSPNGKIFRSTDSGATWTDLGQQGSETHIYSLTYVGDGVVLAGSRPNGKIFRSTDSGATWSDLGQQASETRIYSMAYAGDGVVLAGSSPNGKIFRSTDSGATWSDLGQQSSEEYILSLAYVGDGVVLAGSSPNGKIFRSTDSGVTWTDLGQQGAETHIYSLAYVGDGVVLAGSYPNGKIFRSTDSGATWTDLGQQASETQILSMAYVGDGVVLAGSRPNGKIFRSKF